MDEIKRVIDLRSPQRDLLVARLDVASWQLQIRHRGENCQFDLRAIAATVGADLALVSVRGAETDD